jgi:NAD kinase
MKKENKKSKIRILIVSDHLEKAKKLFLKHKKDIDIVKDNPDIVVTFGGDGTFFKSEFLYPNVPKVYLKYSRIGKLANDKSNEKLISHIVKGEYKIEEKTKLEISYKNKKMFAMADILIHNHNPFAAIRMKVSLDNKLIQNSEIIGDGILISTQIGSTGYYKSITRSYFESDDQIGLAFNNAIDQVSHIVLKKDRVIKIEITRGIADIFADNQQDKWDLDIGDILEIKASHDKVKILKF